MPVLRYAQDARDDLREIGSYTRSIWGGAQAVRYLSEMQSACRMLAENPFLAPLCDDYSFGMRRKVQGSHVIFYRPTSNGIRVVRILHHSQSPGLNLHDQDQ